MDSKEHLLQTMTEYRTKYLSKRILRARVKTKGHYYMSKYLNFTSTYSAKQNMFYTPTGQTYFINYTEVQVAI